MQEDGYWQKLASARLNRRRALSGAAGIGAGAAAAALLAACGGGSSSSSGASSGGAKAGLLTRPVDTTKSAKRGGVFKDSITSDTTWYTFDMNLNSIGADGLAGWVYSRPVKFKTGTADKVADGSIEGDFCESYEISPDGLQVTFKVRSGTKWDSRAPTNGRMADSADFQFSWDRWAKAGVKRASLVNAISPESPVQSVTTPDARTVVMKLAFPFAPLLPLLAYSLFPVMMPKEADGGFDPRSTGRGSGAWQLDQQDPSNVIQLKRNPDWYDNQRPYFDGWSLRVIPDYSQGVAQFKAGNLDTYAVRQEDVLATKQDVPSLQITQRAQYYKSTTAWIFFGGQPDSPFRDDRVRRAMSMEVDRGTWLDIFSNKDKFTAAGLPVAAKWISCIGPGHESYLDPQGSDLGDGAKNYQYSPTEAKKLLTATGLKLPITVPWNVSSINVTPQEDAIRGGIGSVGDFKLEPVLVTDYGREFVPKVQVSHGNFQGVAYQAQADHPDPDWTLFDVFHPSSSDFYMGMMGEDPKVTQLVNAQRRELDRTKRDGLLKDFQRYAATKVFYLTPPGDIKSFAMSQPWVGNFNYYVQWIIASFGGAMESQTIYPYQWFDQTKKSG